MLYLFEDGNSELKGRKFPLPIGIRKHLTQILNNFNGNKNSVGYKRLNNLLSMDGIEYNEMKRIKNFFDNFNGKEDSIEFQLNGGKAMQTWVNNTLSTTTNAIKDFKNAKKEAGMSNAFIKPHTKNRLTKNAMKVTTVKPNFGKDTISNVFNGEIFKFESVIKENNVHPFYDYMFDYGVEYVINLFCSGKYKSEPWGVLINPSMYQKALMEFSKFGRFVNFPSKYVYQWMGICMKNTSMLLANTELAGHTSTYPYEEIEEILLPLLSKKNGKTYELNNYDILTSLTTKEVYEMLYDLNLSPNEEAIVNQILLKNEDSGIHTYGNLKGQKDLFYNQQEVDKYDKNREQLDIANKNRLYVDICKIYNSYEKRNELTYINNSFFLKTDVGDFLDEIGLYDWMILPDGSDAWSDFGIEPIMEIINEYNSNSTPEQTLVIINKILDVYHQRGDLSSMFIQGGSKVLSNISREHFESRNNIKTVIVSENQIIETIKLLSQNS